MENTIILRFRDLVTELGGTIAEHRLLLRSFGEVWWGWWMRQYETIPRAALGTTLQLIETRGPLEAYLFDAGRGQLYQTVIKKIKVAPTTSGLGAPDLERSPEYYQRGRYPAWFLLSRIEESDFPSAGLILDSFPTRPNMPSNFANLTRKPIQSPTMLRDCDCTLWAVRQRERTI